MAKIQGKKELKDEILAWASGVQNPFRTEDAVAEFKPRVSASLAIDQRRVAQYLRSGNLQQVRGERSLWLPPNLGLDGIGPATRSSPKYSPQGAKPPSRN